MFKLKPYSSTLLAFEGVLLIMSASLKVRHFKLGQKGFNLNF